MRQRGVAGNVGWTQQRILVSFIVWKDRLAVSENGGMKLSELASQATRMVWRYLTFKDLAKTVLNFPIASRKEYNKKFVPISAVDIVKDLKGPDLLKWTSAHFYYRYIRWGMILRHESVFDPVEHLKNHDIMFKCLDIKHWDDIEL